MSLMERISNIKLSWDIARSIKQDGGESAYSLLNSIFRGGGDPPRRGTKELMQAYKKMPWLRAVNHRISNSIAGVTWELYVQRGQDNQGRAIRNRKIQTAEYNTRSKLKRRLKENNELEEIYDHPFLELISGANTAMTGRSAIQVTQNYLDLKGETFWILERSNAGMPVEFWPVPPHWVMETPYPGKPYFRVSFSGWQGEIPETEVIWLKDPDPENPYGRGTGTAEALADELETDEYAAKHTKGFFYNRATPDLLVSFEGAGENDVKRAEAKWMEKHKGFWNAFKTHFTNAKMDAKVLSQNFKDMQLKELRQFERDTIMQVYGFPPEIMGVIESSNRATIESADYLYSRWVLVPRLELLRSELQERLIPEFDDRLILDYISPVPEDRQYELEVAKSAPWSRTRNEWRQLQGLPEDELGGDYYMVPANLLHERQDSEPPDLDEIDDGDDEETEGEERSKSPKKKELTDSDIKNVLEDLRPERLEDELKPQYEELIKEWGQRQLRDLGLDISFNMLNPKVTEHLEDKKLDKIRNLINETTKDKLRRTMTEGVREGEGIPDIAKRISEVFKDAKGPRATRIARTEVLESSNFAEFNAQEQSGVVNEREWLATQDDRTREDHLDMDGDVSSIKKPFTAPDGSTAMYPGDFGVAEQDINCRCTTIARIDDPKGYKEPSEEQRVSIWKRFDRDLIPWERTVERAAKRGFQEQEKDLIQRLNELKD